MGELRVEECAQVKGDSSIYEEVTGEEISVKQVRVNEEVQVESVVLVHRG